MRKDARKTCGDTGGGPPKPFRGKFLQFFRHFIEVSLKNYLHFLIPTLEKVFCSSKLTAVMYTDVTSRLHVRGLALVCIILFLNCVLYDNAPFSGPAGSGAFRRGRGSAVEKNGSAFSAAPESRPCVCDRMGVDRRRYLRMLLRFNRFRRGVCDCF